MTGPPRWEPDEHAIDAALASPKAFRKMTELPGPDRSWLVAGLTLAGLTAEDIRIKYSCSLRLVRTIRAEDMTQMAVIARERVDAAEKALYAERSAHSNTRRELELAQREAARVQGQMDQLVKKLCAGEPIATCYRGHPILDGSTYRSRGREFCRECNRENTIAYRERRRKRADQQCHSIRMSPTHVDPIASAS